METLRARWITGSGLSLLMLLAASATAQSAPAPATPTMTPASTTAAPQAQPSSAAPASGTPAGQEQKPADPNAAADDSVLKIVVRPNEVNVVFTVTDKHGKRVTDLKQNDFRVLDDNKPPDEIRSFHAEANLPLQVGLLI